MSPRSTDPLLGEQGFILFFTSQVMGTLGLETGSLQLLSGGFRVNCGGRGLHPFPSTTPSGCCGSVYMGLTQGLEGNSRSPINREN